MKWRKYTKYTQTDTKNSVKDNTGKGQLYENKWYTLLKTTPPILPTPPFLWEKSENSYFGKSHLLRGGGGSRGRRVVLIMCTKLNCNDLIKAWNVSWSFHPCQSFLGIILAPPSLTSAVSAWRYSHFFKCLPQLNE